MRLAVQYEDVKITIAHTIAVNAKVPLDETGKMPGFVN